MTNIHPKNPHFYWYFSTKRENLNGKKPYDLNELLAIALSWISGSEHERHIFRDFNHFLAETNEDRQISCWIDPKGTWYNVPYMLHELFAMYWLEKHHPNYNPLNEKGLPLEYIEKMQKLGWIYVLSGMFAGVMISCDTMNVEQKAVLQERFEGIPEIMKHIEDTWEWYGINA
ncbi:MAG: hypothetical protein ACYTFW_01050 [Planctomycetota bacterium]